MATELRKTSSSANPLLLRLQEILSSWSQSIKDGEVNSASELVNFLETISTYALSNPDDQDAQHNAFEILSEFHSFLLSPASDQEVIDALSFDLPKAVSKFAGLSSQCLESVDGVIDCFIVACNPRDMHSILCEALGSVDRPHNASGYVAVLLSGFSKVFLSIQRRHYEQVKVAIPVILNVLKATTSELDDDDDECIKLFHRALEIADSVKAVCAKLEGILNEKLRALLGLYVLQVMALLSIKQGDKISSCMHLVLQLSGFFPYCGLSYLGLITGSDVDVKVNIVVEEEEDDFGSCLFYTRHGASLSVIWGDIYDEVAQAAKENMSAVKDELKVNQTYRWQALGMLKYILASTNMPWELKKHAISFMLFITTGSSTQKDGLTDCSIYLPSLCATMQAITMVIMYAPNTELRKNAFQALKRIIAETPTSERLDILEVLITKSDSSSLIAILLDLLRGELFMENCHRTSLRKDETLPSENERNSVASIWTGGVLKLVEFVLKPPVGGPPPFPEHGDAVLASLNLYRYILITESSGNTNYTGVLSRNNLQKAYNEWLMPLRTLVTGIIAENKSEDDQFAIDTVCALNPVELVLYRCIELVEERLKQST
ncbi:aberrant root formation protein 4 [Mercurialis annua]|uniref:aberrant root formation protein 4 n=1 Tax=Mercurialis annua TaxID=3986 RepID=UPI002160FB5F|nr:aberrant root formation protein 4 [Mercurialis annua]